MSDAISDVSLNNNNNNNNGTGKKIISTKDRVSNFEIIYFV